MATTKKGSWKKERASVNSRSNKYRPEPSDTDKRPSSGSTSRYWRAGYTRKDGVHVQGHYVTNPHQK
jgi:hypothetical protein